MYSFSIWNQSVGPCPVLTVASWPAYRFLKRQLRWSEGMLNMVKWWWEPLIWDMTPTALFNLVSKTLHNHSLAASSPLPPHKTWGSPHNGLTVFQLHDLLLVFHWSLSPLLIPHPCCLRHCFFHGLFLMWSHLWNFSQNFRILILSSGLQRRRQWHPTPVLSPGKSHGWRSLVGCSPWGR